MACATDVPWHRAIPFMVLMSLMNLFHTSNLGSPQSGWIKPTDPDYFGLSSG
jgi:hypothetical protein